VGPRSPRQRNQLPLYPLRHPAHHEDNPKLPDLPLISTNSATKPIHYDTAFDSTKSSLKTLYLEAVYVFNYIPGAFCGGAESRLQGKATHTTIFNPRFLDNLDCSKTHVLNAFLEIQHYVRTRNLYLRLWLAACWPGTADHPNFVGLSPVGLKLGLRTGALFHFKGLHNCSLQPFQDGCPCRGCFDRSQTGQGQGHTRDVFG
jgi:hypothetical protein